MTRREAAANLEPRLTLEFNKTLLLLYELWVSEHGSGKDKSFEDASELLQCFIVYGQRVGNLPVTSRKQFREVHNVRVEYVP